MRLLKFALAFAGLAASVQFLPIYYHSAQFNEYVKDQVQRNHTQSLKNSLLRKAVEYSFEMREDNINISKYGEVIRVDVDYKVPVDLIVYTHDMRFHSIGSSSLSE